MDRRSFVRLGAGALAGFALGRDNGTLLAEAPGAASAPSGPLSPHKLDFVDASLRSRLSAYLDDLCKWIMTLDPGSNSLKNTKDTRTSIFINGNFARVLLASCKMTGNKDYHDEAMQWCDTFCEIQRLTTTPGGQEAGFWPDCGPNGNIYFGDAGTAVTALAVVYRYVSRPRQDRYLRAMELMARFVTEGCASDPQGQGRQAATRGWVVKEGEAAGALGCGYYEGKLSLEPYTISTATTGGAFFSELYAITGKPEYRDVARGAVKWLITIRKEDGEIPYTLAGQTMNQWPLDTISYCTEAFIAADKYLKDEEVQSLLRTQLKPTVQWLLAKQNPDGSWGKLRSADQQRTPRTVSLLTWYYRRAEADPRIAESVRRYCDFLLKPGNSKAYGVKELVRTSGFVGLTVADILEPDSTF